MAVRPLRRLLTVQNVAEVARDSAVSKPMAVVIYLKTPAGQAALQNRTVVLTPRQRSAFIMFDGKRSSDEILTMTVGLGVTQADLDHLVEQGLLVAAAPAAKPVLPLQNTSSAPISSGSPDSSVASKSSEPAAATPSSHAQAAYLKAYPVATRLTASLGFRGFRLNLAVEAAGNLQELRELAPKIREAVGPEKFRELEEALR
jgi:hypothetical protein